MEVLWRLYVEAQKTVSDTFHPWNVGLVICLQIHGVLDPIAKENIEKQYIRPKQCTSISLNGASQGKFKLARWVLYSPLIYAHNEHSNAHCVAATLLRRCCQEMFVRLPDTRSPHVTCNRGTKTLIYNWWHFPSI